MLKLFGLHLAAPVTKIINSSSLEGAIVPSVEICSCVSCGGEEKGMSIIR